MLLARQMSMSKLSPDIAKLYHHLLDDFIRYGLVCNTVIEDEDSRAIINNLCMVVGATKEDTFVRWSPKVYLDNVPLSECMRDKTIKNLMLELSRSVWGWTYPQEPLGYLSQRDPRNILINIPEEEGKRHVWMGYRGDDFVISVERNPSGRARTIRYK